MSDDIIELQETVIGHVEFSDSVVVSDPCYDRGTWCGEFGLDIKPGKYEGRALHGHLADWPTWGERVHRLSAVRVDERIDRWVYCTSLGVDAGRMSIYDDEHYDAKGDEWKGPPQYQKHEHGFVSSSGLGDGSYPLYHALNDKDEIVGYSVVFLIPNWALKPLVDEDQRYDMSDDSLTVFAGGPASVFLKTEEEE